MLMLNTGLPVMSLVLFTLVGSTFVEENTRLSPDWGTAWLPTVPPACTDQLAALFQKLSVPLPVQASVSGAGTRRVSNTSSCGRKVEQRRTRFRRLLRRDWDFA